MIQTAVSIASTKITGREMDFIVSRSTRNTAPMAIRLTFTVSAVSLGWKKENGQSGVRWEIWDILAQCVRERYRTSEARLSLESDMGHLYNKS